MDGLSLISRVVERAAEQCPEATGLLPEGAPALSEDQLVDLFAGQLLALFGIGSVGAGGESPAGEDVQLLAGLAERNHALATALGACDCWGELFDCAHCGGAGSPGWEMPERDTFEEFVAPALARLRAARAPRRNGHNRQPWMEAQR